MRHQQDIQQNLSPEVKIIMLGASKVGKTTLLKKWVHGRFIPYYKATLGLDHEYKDLKITTSLTIKLSLHEIAGNQSSLSMKKDNPRSNVDGNKAVDLDLVLFKNTKIFFIFISTDCTEEERIKQIKQYQVQIKSWQEKIQYDLNADKSFKVIVIENKYERGSCLSAEQLSQIGFIKSDQYVALSLKDDSFSELENTVNKILPQVITQTPQCPPLAGIIKIDDKQADRVLNFVENMIKQGTAHDNKKPFKVGLFGLGGKAYEYQFYNAENESQKQIANMPNHVVSLLKNIETYRTQKTSKDILVDIYHQTLQIINAEKTVTRQVSTQVFYVNTLPQYILRSVQPATIDIHAKIDSLQNNRAKEILQIVKNKLLEGVTNNPDNPYDVNFFGGDTYNHNGKVIKLPQHVVLLITKIDQCMNKNSNEMARHALSEIYQDIIQAQLTPNAYRNNKTKEFYHKVLPNFIVELINPVLEVDPIPVMKSNLIRN